MPWRRRFLKAAHSMQMKPSLKFLVVLTAALCCAPTAADRARPHAPTSRSESSLTGRSLISGYLSPPATVASWAIQQQLTHQLAPALAGIDTMRAPAAPYHPAWAHLRTRALRIASVLHGRAQCGMHRSVRVASAALDAAIVNDAASEPVPLRPSPRLVTRGNPCVPHAPRHAAVGTQSHHFAATGKSITGLTTTSATWHAVHEHIAQDRAYWWSWSRGPPSRQRPLTYNRRPGTSPADALASSGGWLGLIVFRGGGA